MFVKVKAGGTRNIIVLFTQQYHLKGTTSASQAIAIGRTVNLIASILAGIDLDRVHIHTAEKAH